MLTYIARRIMLLFPTLLGVLAVVFFIMAFAPGGFGGAALSEEGSQSEGDDAKRLRQQFERRYGLDKPKPVQFARWLNQVSPLGFRMSGDIKLNDKDVLLVQETLADQPFNTRDARLGQAVGLVETIAGYADRDAMEVAEELDAALTDPTHGLALLDWVDSELADAERAIAVEKLATLQAAPTRGLERAQNELLRLLAFEASGRSKVRFDRPAFKAPDLGESLRGRRVTSLLWERVPVTILLNILSIPLIYMVAITSGLYAARRRGGWFDVGSGGVFIGLWSVPTIWAGVLLITYFANSQFPATHWFPTSGLHDLQADRMAFLPGFGADGFERGWLLDTLWHLVLPVLCMTYGGFAVMSKVMRGAMLDSLSADYVRTAQAKGLSETVVLWRHAFRNSVLPLITMVSGILPALFAGSVVVETIFSLNGLGKLSIEAAFAKDREVIMATTLFAGLLGLTSELIRDVCYAIADPRVSYD